MKSNKKGAPWKQDRSCLVFFQALGCLSSLGKTDTSSWSPNCALGSRPLQMLLKDLWPRGPVDAVDLLAVSLWCWTAVLTPGEQDVPGPLSWPLPDELSCSLPATTLPRESPQAEQPQLSDHCLCEDRHWERGYEGD